MRAASRVHHLLRGGLPLRVPHALSHSCHGAAAGPPPLGLGTPPAPPPSHVDDDFVDVGDLSLNTGSAQARPPSNTSGPVVVAPTDALGVTRRTPLPPETEFSRFHIPLEVPRQGRPVLRPGSRAAFSPEEQGRLWDGAHTTAAGAGRADDGADATPEEPVDVSLMVANALEEDAAGNGGAALPRPDTTLPYDDEAFAETLLQMEVDGIIDEAWQDSRKAHIEDVKEVTEVLRSLKVRDICCIDVSGKTGNFDYMLFGTCEGPRHIHLAAWAAQEADSLKRVSKIPRRKTDELWEVVPIGRIVLNLMVESLRDELTLERKWAVTRTMDPLDVANAPVSEGRHVRAHGLWSLTLNLQDLEDFEVDYCKDVLLRQV